MFWNRYDKATGAEPVIGDRVENCHTGSQLPDGSYRGIFAGWGTYNKQIGIVILEKSLDSGELAITLPVVCMRKIQ